MDFGNLSPKALHFIVTHVSLPPKLPQQSDKSSSDEHSLCKLIHHCAVTYEKLLPQIKQAKWGQIVRLLENIMKLHVSNVFSPDEIQRSMAYMQTGGRQLTNFFRAMTVTLLLFYNRCYRVTN